jgi:hypothetical protein
LISHQISNDVRIPCTPGLRHRLLDGQRSSHDEAIADAIAWVEPFAGLNQTVPMNGVDVSTGNGYWRTCRLPGSLLCSLLCLPPG